MDLTGDSTCPSTRMGCCDAAQVVIYRPSLGQVSCAERGREPPARFSTTHRVKLESNHDSNFWPGSGRISRVGDVHCLPTKTVYNTHARPVSHCDLPLCVHISVRSSRLDGKSGRHAQTCNFLYLSLRQPEPQGRSRHEQCVLS